MALLNGRTILSGALGLTAVLAWNDAVKAAVESMFPPNSKGGARAMFAYALVVTIIVIALVASINLCARHINRFVDKAASPSPAAPGPDKDPLQNRPTPRLGGAGLLNGPIFQLL